MAHTTVTCSYSATATRQTAVQLAAAMAAVPVDLSVPQMVGLIPSSDSTSTVGAVVTRTIALAIGGVSSFGGADVQVQGGSPTGPIRAITVAAGVSGAYPAPPVLSISDATGEGAVAQVTSSTLSQVFILSGGSGYTSAPAVEVVGGNNGSGVDAVVTCTINGSGQVNSVTLVNPGSGYTTFVELAFIGGGGSGAEAYIALKPLTITVTQGGRNYTAPTVTLTPLFTASIPDSSDQTAPVQGWMQAILQIALACPVTAAEPVVS